MGYSEGMYVLGKPKPVSLWARGSHIFTRLVIYLTTPRWTLMSFINLFTNVLQKQLFVEFGRDTLN